MPIARADTGSPCTACTGTALERGTGLNRTLDKRLLALILGSSIHGPASLPKRRAMPTPYIPGTSQHAQTREVCFQKYAAGIPIWEGSSGGSGT
ncbi:hypothetical protein QFZ56_006159 [Streptomyces achromogenes]|uniref:Uncharacterized protein n=1 Tax=Streptomyces achromogenes TaxID=67255 RepID=A0ABU0QA02_STRAH|nr:hypothetical protein [Streptomyces achromogenes]